MKMLKSFLVLGLVGGCILSFTACGNKSLENTMYISDDDSEDEEYVLDDDSLEEDISHDYMGEIDTFSLDDMIITEEFAFEVHAVMQAHSFEDYKNIDAIQWGALNEEKKHQAYEVFFGILLDLGLPVNAEEVAWIKAMDEDADFYTDYLMWGFAFQNMGFTEPEKLNLLDKYIQDIKEQKYAPLHPDIFNMADDITIEYNLGQYLLCTGGDHDMAQMTREWTTEETWFMTTGSITPVANDDIFEEERVEYSISGENGKMTTASIGEVNLLPVFRGMGALGEDGSMAHEQIQMSAKTTFDAPSLYILSEGTLGKINIAILKYSKDDKKYVWDNKVLVTNYRSCFSKDGAFCYIGENGELHENGGMNNE